MATRKALGKGLSALIPEADKLVEGEGYLLQCPVDTIEPNPYQPRQDFSGPELEEMVSSVREKGIITPLLVSKTEKGYQLIAGERRWRAAQRAGLDEVPVVIKDVTPSESLELAIIENIHRKDLNPIEEANAYKRLLDETGATQEAIAKRLGKDRSSIANLLRLLNLPESIQKDVINGRLSMGHARVLAGIKGREEQVALRNIIIRNDLSVRALEGLTKKKKKSAPSKENISELDYYYQSLEEKLKRSLGTKVNLKKKGKEGQIILYFYSDEELDRLFELLT